MAATNRARGAEKTPAWAARNKASFEFVPGGPAHAAWLVHSGGWQSDPAALHAACTRYEPALIGELLDRRAGTVALTWFNGLSPRSLAAQRASLALLLPLLRKKKIRALAEIVLDAACAADLRAHAPALLDLALKNSDGTPRQIPGAPACLWMDAARPEWLALVCEACREAAGRGFDGLHFSCMAAAADTGDTGDTGAGNADVLAATIRACREAARSCQSEGAPELLASGPAPENAALCRACNFKFHPAGIRPRFENDRLSSNLPLLKYLYECGGRGKALAAGFPKGDLSADEAALAAAETMASGAACADPRTPAAYGAFYAEHAECYGGDPVNSMGILLSASPERRAGGGAGGGAIGNAAPLLDELMLANLQFDVIPAADLAAFELRKYRVVCALHPGQMDESTAHALHVFATEHGGTVLDESALAAAGTDLANLARLAENPLQCDAPRGVACLLWGKGTRRWVHVLNFTGAQAEAAITLPGCGGRQLRAISPDDPPPALELLETGSARAAFRLKGLARYAVVEVL